MPSTKLARNPNHHSIAQEPILADQFIPRFLHVDDKVINQIKQNNGIVGVRGFNCPDYERYSPYLMMSDITVAPPLLFPDHPHYGHEMALYVLEGEFTHEDFGGWKETFKTGDFHWMTAGQGIVHAQTPGAGPRNRHVQFWINLPKDKKQAKSANQMLRSHEIPHWKDQYGAEISLLVGRYGGFDSPINTFTPLLMMDVKLKAVEEGQPWKLYLPGNFMIGLYVIEGKGQVGEHQLLQTGSIITSQPTDPTDENTVLSIKAESSQSLRFLVFAGKPIQEPIDFEGFFVCNERHETSQVIKDFEQCTNGFAKGKAWSSQIANHNAK